MDETGAETMLAGAMSNRRAWALAVFAARETPADLFMTIEAAMASGARSERTVIDVLVNGNPELAAATAAYARSLPPTSAAGPLLRIWSIALGDKSHAWNQYLHEIWPGSALAFFIDGYVRLRPDALERLARSVLAAAPQALGGSGVPSVGRAAAAIRKAMTTEGGIHGNYCCVTRETLLELRRRQFRFPIGLYRADALLGAMLAFRLDPALHKWDLRNAIRVEPAATWATEPKRWWRLADIRATLRRRDRQAQGELENLAIIDHMSVRKQRPEDLPRTAMQLVLDWAERCPDAARMACAKDQRVARAFEQFRKSRDWSAAQHAPSKLFGEDALEG